MSETRFGFEQVAMGFYIEALAIDSDAIWYSDVVQGGIHRLSSNGVKQSWFVDKKWIGGILLNEDGCVLSSGPGGIAWLDPETGASGMLLDAIDGAPIAGVNEMTPDGMGGVFFGTVDLPAIERGETPGPVALYRMGVDRRVRRLCDGLVFTNGLSTSLDGQRLFHNESFVGTFSYTLKQDGSLGPKTQLLEKPDCDGMALDSAGNLWITGFRSNELLNLSPDGNLIRRIATPAGAITNVRFGGPQNRSLFITSVPSNAGDGLADGVMPKTQNSAIYRAQIDISGRAGLRTRFALKR